MRKLSLLFGAVLLVQGVFGVDEVKTVSVSVMVGDSLTLNSDFTETNGDELEWRIEGESDVIAQIDREANKISISGNNEERFRDRLKLDHQTGSLTITDIINTDSGVYKLKIKDSRNENTCRFIVTVRDVFFVGTDGVKSVSVTGGDTVTLHTDVTPIQRGDAIQWFGDQGVLIADLNSPRWRNIDLNVQTGDLTIRNIQRDQYGNYKVEINSNSIFLQRKFYMAVDEMKTVSVKEGESVTLRTGAIDIKIYDLILWKFKDHLIAKIIKLTNQMSLYDTSDERFKGRLQLNEKTGSLTISDSRTTDTEDYSLHMISSSHTVQRTIGVTVTDLRSSGSGSGISGVSVVLMAWAITVFLLQEV